MIRKLRTWLALFTLGPVRNVSRTIESSFRYHVLKTLDEEGLFDYLSSPHTYGEILANFGYEDSEYARELVGLLANGDRNVLHKDGDLYRINPEQPVPTYDEFLAETDERYRNFALIAEGLAKNILLRLQRKPVEYTDSFVEEGREMLQRFDKLLSIRLYTVMRDMSFALLKPKERAWLRGKKFLEVGCGSGIETVDLWQRLEGDVYITAMDPVSTMIERAERNFDKLLDEQYPDHPQLTPANRPVFDKASATNLPYEDGSFDAAFYVHMLHWTPDPEKAVSEMVRVVKPGGLIFGTQIIKPAASDYSNIVFRSNENCYGTFWKEEHQRWYAKQGVQLEVVTPPGAFRARKPD